MAVIGTGNSFVKSDLPVGRHVITLTVTDSGGQTGAAQVIVIVQAAGPSRPALMAMRTASIRHAPPRARPRMPRFRR